MILPGHVAASVLCHRYLKIDLRVALVVAVLPDIVDKTLYYALLVVPSTRIPMHTLLAWLSSTLLVGITESLLNRNGCWRWTIAWFVAYGAHLLCDSLLVWDPLPFLYPFRAYDFLRASDPNERRIPLSFLFGMGEWPVYKLVSELLLTAFAVYTEWRHGRAESHRQTVVASRAAGRSRVG